MPEFTPSDHFPKYSSQIHAASFSQQPFYGQVPQPSVPEWAMQSIETYHIGNIQQIHSRQEDRRSSKKGAVVMAVLILILAFGLALFYKNNVVLVLVLTLMFIILMLFIGSILGVLDYSSIYECSDGFLLADAKTQQVKLA